MKKISSGSVFFLKKIFPVIWLGTLGAIIVPVYLGGAFNRPGGAVIVFGPCLMIVIGAFVYRRFVWDLADEVYDGGTFLRVHRGSEEDTIPLDNIMNVSASVGVNPPRITLRLVKPGRFGNEISFSPLRSFSLTPFAKNPIAEDLIVRVDAARRSGVRR
jgi:hypothetical protein